MNINPLKRKMNPKKPKLWFGEIARNLALSSAQVSRKWKEDEGDDHHWDPGESSTVRPRGGGYALRAQAPRGRGCGKN